MNPIGVQLGDAVLPILTALKKPIGTDYPNDILGLGDGVLLWIKIKLEGIAPCAYILAGSRWRMNRHISQIDQFMP